MAWSEAEKVKIRHWLGFSALYANFYPMLESAMLVVLSRADGGNWPDNSTETHIRGVLTRLDAIETRITEQLDYLAAMQVETIRVDAARAILMLRNEGRRMVKALSTALSTNPLSDVFAPPTYTDGGMRPINRGW